MDQPWHSVFDNSMHHSWLYFCYRFDASVVNSLTLSIPFGSCHSVFIDNFKVYCSFLLAGDLWISHDITFWQFHVAAMTLFLLSILCIVREFIDAIDSIQQLSLNIHWRFRGQLLLCFGRWFMDQPWHCVFGNSMHPPWLYFYYRFDT